jgi:hypothetical protein
MNDKKVKVFKNDYGKYKIGISNKAMDGTYDNAYFSVQFRKDVELDNQTDIIIKDSWLTFYRNKENEAVPYLFINDFATVDSTPRSAGW